MTTDVYRGPGVGFTTRVRREAERLYRRGLSCRAVARELERKFEPAPSQESICQWMRAAGVLRSKSEANRIKNANATGIRYSEAMESKALRLYVERGESLHETCRRLGVSRSTVTRWLRKHEVRIRTPREATIVRNWGADRVDVVERWAGVFAAWRMKRLYGYTYPEICEQLDISPATAFDWVRRYESRLELAAEVPEVEELLRRREGEICWLTLNLCGGRAA